MLKSNDTSILQIFRKEIDTQLLRNLLLFTLLFGVMAHGGNFFNTDYAYDGYIELIGDVLVVKFPYEKPLL